MTTGRPLDFNYKTNKVIAIVSLFTLIAGIVFQLVTGKAFLNSLLWAAGAGAAVFLTWAIARELDPDHHWAAFPGVVIMLIALPLVGLPGFILLFWLLTATRVLNHTTGLRPGLADSVVLTILTGWLLWKGYWIPGVLTVVVFILDGFMDGENRKQFVFGVVNLILIITGRFLELFYMVEVEIEMYLAIGTLLVTLFFLPVIISSSKVESTGDNTGDKLDPVRVQLGMIISIVAMITVIITNGLQGFISFAPVVASIVGLSLSYYARLFAGN